MPANTILRADIGGWIMASMDAAAGLTTTRLPESQSRRGRDERIKVTQAEFTFVAG
jgi:hypothetical protein